MSNTGVIDIRGVSESGLFRPVDVLPLEELCRTIYNRMGDIRQLAGVHGADTCMKRNPRGYEFWLLHEYFQREYGVVRRQSRNANVNGNVIVIGLESEFGTLQPATSTLLSWRDAFDYYNERKRRNKVMLALFYEVDFRVSEDGIEDLGKGKIMYG
jgi:hypothetical protein